MKTELAARRVRLLRQMFVGSELEGGRKKSLAAKLFILDRECSSRVHDVNGVNRRQNAQRAK
jgi:hypothetical protein